MHPKMIAKQIIDFNKATFDNTFDAITVLQEQSEKMIESFLDKATIFPEEGKYVIINWVDTYKKSREDFKAAVDDSFKIVEDFFVGAANAMGFSMYGIAERTDKSLNEVADKFKKVSVAVVGKSIQTIAAATDKVVKPVFAVKKEVAVKGRTGTGKSVPVLNKGKKPVTKTKK